ncbi:MAG: diaminopimelate epimerase [Candidatus Eremiobacteraeota bacterium]|nr:diaminopimelate epimerase [Candidatus Eremiobacteraeota bacterium]
MPTIALTKCQGTGNDFMLFDDRAGSGLPYPALARNLCDRRFGVGADGLLVLSVAGDATADLRMRIFNADGSEAEMCGNGIRCVSHYVARTSGKRSALAIETAKGVVRAEPQDEDMVRVAMGVPRVIAGDERVEIGGQGRTVTRVNIGNPHAVVFVEEPLESIDLTALARTLSRNGSETNVEVARMTGNDVEMRVYERGVGETWACGTGACAAAVAAVAHREVRSPVKVATKGGEVVVNWPGDGEPAHLTGPAQLLFDLQIEVGPDGRIIPTAP